MLHRSHNETHAHAVPRAFTLIELLVVVAIISLLTAILFPVFSRAREKARQATCLSNLKQMGLAIMMYTQDYDETYPPCWVQSNGVWGDTIVDALDPYTKSRGIWKCPSQSTTPIQPYIASGVDSPSWPYNYVVNYHLIGIASEPPNWASSSLAAVDDPSGTLMMFCWPGISTGDTLYQGSAGEVIYKLNQLKNAGAPDPFLLHNGGSQILYADAHAKWKPPSEILTASTWTLADD